MIGRKSRAYGTLFYVVYGKITQLKTTSTKNVSFSSRCFQDYNLHPWVRGFLYVFSYTFLFLGISFFRSDNFFKNFCFKGDNLYTKIIE